MQLSDNALIVLEKRYFKKDGEGRILEDWDALITRVATNVAGNDPDKIMVYKELLDSGNFLPNSPTLMNAAAICNSFSAMLVLLPITTAWTASSRLSKTRP